MNAVSTIVDALEELAMTGRLSDGTRAKLSEAVVGERYGHPGFQVDGGRQTVALVEHGCHYEELETVRCPICRDEDDGPEPG